MLRVIILTSLVVEASAPRVRQGGIEALSATDLWRTVLTHSDPPAYYIHEKYYCTFVPAGCSNCVRYKMEKYCVWFDILVSDKVMNKC